MSQFLAPIHQIMFTKIQYLNSITEELLSNEENLAKVVNEKFKKLEVGQLENLIDISNIHGWLQERVLLVEERLAFVASGLVKKGKEDFLFESFYKIGERENFQGNAQEAFQKMEQSFLDGMPCDHVNELLGHSQDSLSWIVNEDVHSIHYQYGVEGDIYNKMRRAWFEGLLSKTSYTLKKEGQKYTIEN